VPNMTTAPNELASTIHDRMPVILTERGERLWLDADASPEEAITVLASHPADLMAAFPRDQWPDARIVHPAFQIMVGAGFWMLGVAAWYWWAWWRGRRRAEVWAAQRRLLWVLVLSAPLGFLVLEAGWIVTEVGR
jgi:cytochrome bd-type quinol oxidase subunit 1